MLFSVYLWTKVPRKRLFGTIRVLAYGLVVSAGLGALTVRNAVADAEDQGLQVGRRLADLSDLLQSGTEFRLNGQRIYFSNANTPDSVGKVLDRFEANCNAQHAFDPMAWKALADANSKIPEEAKSRFGVVRKEDPKTGDGMVMCFTSDHGPREFFSAIEQFEKTGDLHELGDVRYVHAAPHKWVDHKTKASHVDTFVQTVWTEGSFNIRALIGPENADSAGSDFATLPRPMNSLRRFTADAVGTPYGARVYESTAEPEAVLGDYDSKMVRDGWLGVNNPVQPLPDGQLGRWYTKLETGEQAAISIEKIDGKTMVAVGAMGVIDKAPAKETATR